MPDAPIAVLGTGMAGAGAGHAIQAHGARFVCYDKNPHRGGHTCSIRYNNGFVFDEGPHISFTKNERVRELLANAVQGRHEERRFAIDNYWHGYRIPHPVQCHLKELPVELTIKIIRDFANRAEYRSDKGYATYAQWLYAAYGKTFAELFPMVYGTKYHTTTMDRLTTDWIGPRMYQPTLEELLRGALASQTPDKHYIQTFRYPLTGGFASYVEGLSSEFDVRLNHRLIGIDPQQRLMRFANGEVQRYSAVISSIPLPDLVPLIDRVPTAVLDAARRLSFSTVVLFNVGLNRADISNAATTYFYDEDIAFSRVCFPHMFAESNAPVGCGSIQVEVYFSDRYCPPPSEPKSLLPSIIRDLRRCQLIKEQDEILLADANVVRYANIIYDADRAAAVAIVHAFLDEMNIHYCGRFGRWDHSWTDEAFVSGEASAHKVLDAHDLG